MTLQQIAPSLKYKVYWVEGIIGAGKSTLAKALADQFNLRPIYEPVEDNPFLPLFYENPGRWSFSMQMYLMVRRLGLQRLAVAESLSGSTWDGAVLDRGLPGDRVFCSKLVDDGLIHPMEWHIYEWFYDLMAMEIRPPSLIIYLEVDPEVAYERVRMRDRAIEREGVSLDYLKSLHEHYEKLMTQIESREHVWSRGMEVLRVDWNTPQTSELLGVLPSL